METSLQGLPGAELVEAGLRDLERGVDSAEALLVAIGAPRLRSLGLALPPPGRLPDRPELRLYELLGREAGRSTHARYNALVRRLVSFERCLARERRRAARPDP